MSDSSDDGAKATEPADATDADGSGEAAGDDAPADIEALREQVEEKYDFENFGPEQMAEMSPAEWEAAFDSETWITGPELLDRVEADLKSRVVERDVFARVERLGDDRIIAYSDEGYAAVTPNGSVEGYGTVLRDVKPTVALCSMESYDVPEMPDGEVLPEPADVPEGSGELGNLVLQVIAGVQVIAGIGLIGAWLVYVVGLLQPPAGVSGRGLNLVVLLVAGLAFLVVGVGLFMVVANARLSDRFRAEEYRNRLRAVGLEDDERPDFLPVEDGEWTGESTAAVEDETGAERDDLPSGDSDDDSGTETRTSEGVDEDRD